MNTFKPFENGIQSTLHASWDLELITPLTIRHGSTVAWQSKPESLKKGRNQEMQFSWANPENDWSEVSDFNDCFSIIQDQLTVQYEIPASSIRGALRQWTIKNLIERQDWNVFDVPLKEELTDTDLPKYIERAQDNLKDKTKRWRDVLSLFGCAYDLDPEISDPLAWIGRLKVTTFIPETENTDYTCRVSGVNLLTLMARIISTVT